MKGTGCGKKLKVSLVYVLDEQLDSEAHLLSRALSNSEEVGDIGGSEDGVLSSRVLLLELLEELGGLVELGVALERRDLERSRVDVGKALLDTTNPVADEVAKRGVDPALLVGNVHEANHASVDLAVGHIGQIAGLAVGLGSELWSEWKEYVSSKL